MTFVFCIAFTAMFFGNVLFLTERWHRSIFEAGLWISPGPLAVMPVAIFAGRRADRIVAGVAQLPTRGEGSRSSPHAARRDRPPFG